MPKNLFPVLPVDYIQLVFTSEQKNVEAAANRLMRCGGKLALMDNQQLVPPEQANQQATSSKQVVTETPKQKRKVTIKRTQGQVSQDKITQCMKS